MNRPSALRKELSRIIEAVEIRSPAAFTFAGRPSTGIAPPIPGLQLTPGMPPCIGELVGLLYENCFCRPFTAGPPPAQTPVPNDGAWIETLSAANLSRERWEEGWQVVYQMPNGSIAAQRGAITRTLAPGEFVNLTGSGPMLSPSTPVRIFVARESRGMQPGYYFAFGETCADSSDEFSLVRFYWHVTAQGAPELLRRVSTELNRWEVPFRFKTVSHRERFGRSDSAVLYTPRRYARFALELAREIHGRVRAQLREDAPLFALRLASGLGFAEDPGTSESFGMSRCRLLAEGIWLAYAEQARSVGQRLEVVERRFRSQGISIERPWLNSGSADEFAFGAEAAEAA